MKNPRRNLSALFLVTCILAVGCSKAGEPETTATIPPEAKGAETPAPAPAAQPAEMARAAKPAQPTVKVQRARLNTTSRPAPVAESVVQTPVASVVPPPSIIRDEPFIPERIVEQAPPEPLFHEVTIPTGAVIAVRMVDSVDSKNNRPGDIFKATLDAPVSVQGETVLPRGAEVALRLVDVQSAGKLSGRSQIRLELDKVYVGNKAYAVNSTPFEKIGEGQGAKTARTVGAGAAIGAIIGAISGGKKGAVIGAGTGAGAGVGVEAVTDGQQVRVDSESRVEFRLREPLQITVEETAPHSTRNRQLR